MDIYSNSVGTRRFVELCNDGRYKKCVSSDEAVAGSGLEGNYSMHCFRWGGAQYWFIHAPDLEKWSMDVVQFWGGSVLSLNLMISFFVVEPAFFS